PPRRNAKMSDPDAVGNDAIDETYPTSASMAELEDVYDAQLQDSVLDYPFEDDYPDWEPTNVSSRRVQTLTQAPRPLGLDEFGAREVRVYGMDRAAFDGYDDEDD